ncbi:hypothetical protein COS81_04160 [candidate division WWE3 bacterium CG06_land_8_20_14_3_00_42_16]|uniref:Uncharacterized protein n=4 Tax=Katanobacteria TaxID=422282 RepID=A0A2M7ALW5_UNCKA|nr:MAG: hypothetical protein COS81_04160 [candidate division WWE3 bacterium CG06_land_8_20_14_3_00_42_16]PIZ42911.1 MAG: hypothetical protein COY34_01915 [candidate division WWE3 bacterium CG_4_10_14_0_2_um_filter_42_8]PJA38113.1 MAG: hypothetical protein CO181_01130 [candidate division WWE3 bacterium CG_4_9_14_3_um_filter_43_9]PJC68357.1 MAG: hypothetical protein CO015_04235 [candidate division WWE3 bacterium CG_4_8_14_3_um_filter_42_11]
MSNEFLNSSTLYNTPSFLKGVARVIDLFGQLDEYDYKKTEKEADAEALRRDWYIVGQDIFDGVEKYERGSRQPNQV